MELKILLSVKIWERGRKFTKDISDLQICSSFDIRAWYVLAEYCDDKEIG